MTTRCANAVLWRLPFCDAPRFDSKITEYFADGWGCRRIRVERELFCPARLDGRQIIINQLANFFNVVSSLRQINRPALLTFATLHELTPLFQRSKSSLASAALRHRSTWSPRPPLQRYGCEIAKNRTRHCFDGHGT